MWTIWKFIAFPRAHNTIYTEYTPNTTHPTPATYYSGLRGLRWDCWPAVEGRSLVWKPFELKGCMCVLVGHRSVINLSWHWESAKPANILFLRFLQWVLWFWKALKILGYVCYGLDGFMRILLTVAALLDGLKITLHMCRNAVISRAVAAAHQLLCSMVPFWIVSVLCWDCGKKQLELFEQYSLSWIVGC